MLRNLHSDLGCESVVAGRDRSDRGSDPAVGRESVTGTAPRPARSTRPPRSARPPRPPHAPHAPELAPELAHAPLASAAPGLLAAPVPSAAAGFLAVPVPSDAAAGAGMTPPGAARSGTAPATDGASAAARVQQVQIAPGATGPFDHRVPASVDATAEILLDMPVAAPVPVDVPAGAPAAVLLDVDEGVLVDVPVDVPVDVHDRGERLTATDAQLDRGALDHMLRYLTPLPFVLVPFPLLLLVLLRTDVSAGRAVTWLSLAAIGAGLSLAVQRRAARVPVDAAVGRTFHALLRLSLLVHAVVFGLGPWVVSSAQPEVVVLCAMFPAIVGAAAAVVCAGRTRDFAVFLAPLVATTVVSLLHAGAPGPGALSLAVAAYGVGMVALHRALTASLHAAIQVRTRSERLVDLLAAERATLTELNARLSASNAQLVHLALHDPLTGLYNRRGTLETIDALLASSSGPVALLFLDLDRFKAVNDALGHRGGDHFLIVLADRISRTLDADCVAGRMGGDEFVLALPDHDLARAAAVASRLVGVLAQPVHAEGREIPSSVSVGVAVHPTHGATTSDLLRNANAALYRAKHAGRNRVELFDADMQIERDAAIEAEQSLRRALDHGEIVPFFQPEIDAGTGRIVGAELLARWLRRDGTVVHAAEFIALAKRTGLLERLTERVLTQARPHIRRLASLGLPDGFRFRVNLGPAATDRSWRLDPLEDIVHGIDPTLLTVDVRESAVSGDLEAAAATLAAFRARGGRVCLDDFARGVSSLSLLRLLPVDEVRIDRTAIDSITTHPHDRAIVRSIIAVVREIGLAVTAEGVETGAQADALIALGCVRQQGHLYAAALPAEAFESFLLDRLAEGYVAGESTLALWDPTDLV